MYTCYRCAKIIKGTVTHHVPPIISIQLGIDFHKTFHPICYERAEEEAKRELMIDLPTPAKR